MNVVVDQRDLSQALRTVGRAIASRSTLPVLQQVLMRVEGKRLEMTATDLEIGMRYRIHADVIEEGAVLVPGRLLTEYVSSLQGGEMRIETWSKEHKVKVVCGRSEAVLSTMAPDEFPAFTDDEGPTMEVEPDAFKTLIEEVEFTAAKDESRPILTGVMCRFDERSLTMAAADGFRLAVSEIEMTTGIKPVVRVIVPARAMREMARVITDQKNAVRFGVSKAENQVMMSAGYVDVISQVIAGKFPDYSQIMPDSHQTRVVVDRSALLGAVRTAHIFAREAAHLVRLKAEIDIAGNGKLVLRSRSTESGESFCDLDADVSGDEPAEIAFNAQYLVDALAAMKAGKVTLDVVNANRPGVIRPVGAPYPTYVLMPMHVDPEPRRGYVTVEEMDAEAEGVG